MKAKLIFNLDDREDDLSFKRSVKALDMAFVLFNFGLNSRKTIENNLKDCDESYDAVEAVYKRFWELCEEYVIDVNSLIE